MNVLDGYLDENIASLFPLDLGGEIVALRACLDAGRRETGVYCVAGVAFGYQNARKANNEWEKILGGRTFHMSDLHYRVNDFEGLDDAEVDRIMRGVVGVVRRYASYVVAFSCDANLVSDDLPTEATRSIHSQQMLGAFRSEYGFMCHTVMCGLGAVASNRQSEISYVLEKGDHGQGGFAAYLDFIRQFPAEQTLLSSYAYARHTITPKDKLEGVFHAADLVAWEWAKNVDRYREGRNIRPSFKHLTKNKISTDENEYGLTSQDNGKLLCRHLDTTLVKRHLEFYRSVLVATNEADVKSALNRWSEGALS